MRLLRRDALEKSVLQGLHTHLMEPGLFREFCAEFTREVNRRRIERSSGLEAARRELDKTVRDLDKAIDAILAGAPPLQLKERMEKLEAHKAELTGMLTCTEEPPPLLHPNMAEIYHQRISALYGDLQNEETTAQAAQTFRSLVERIDLVPDGNELQIVLRGDLEAILRFAAGKKNPDVLSEVGVMDDLLSQGSVVARACNTRFLRLVERQISKLAA
ncbi:hypothetical protein ACUSIJ_25300 [Pseudochelatococcus sp. B33]